VIIDLSYIPGTVRHVGRWVGRKIHRGIRLSTGVSVSKVSMLARKEGREGDGSLGSGLCHKESLVF